MKIESQPIYKGSSFCKLAILTIITLSIVLTVRTSAYSQGNNYFGADPTAGIGNGASSGPSNATSSASPDYSKDLPEDSNPNAVLPGLNDTAAGAPKPTGTDFTGDEKRMQKKYKSNIAHANNLIARGTQMMKSSDNNHNNAVYKKGKILKEIGEKSLTELKANNPFPEQKVK